MIGLIVLCIDCWRMAFGYDSFIDNKGALIGATIIELILEFAFATAFDENPWEKIERIINERDR